MKYNFYAVGDRIRQMRKKKFSNQDDFIDVLRDKYKVPIGRNKVSAIENGEQCQFTLPFLLACCDIFNCDMGYLLGEYECKTRDSQFIHDQTGLPEATVHQLHHWHEIWGSEITDTIAVLVEDMLYHNVDEKRGFQPILQLLAYFLTYQHSATQQLVFSNGLIKERKNYNYLPSNAIALDSTIIENATLAEIQYALKSLKKSRSKEEDK